MNLRICISHIQCDTDQGTKIVQEQCESSWLEKPCEVQNSECLLRNKRFIQKKKKITYLKAFSLTTEEGEMFLQIRIA